MDTAETFETPFRTSASMSGACICGGDATSQWCSCQGATLPYRTGSGDRENGHLAPHNAMGSYRGW